MSPIVRRQLIRRLDETLRPFRSTPSTPQSSRHPLSLLAGLTTSDKELQHRKEWSKRCDRAQRETFRAVAKILSGVDKSIHTDRKLDDCFDRSRFMLHHISCAMTNTVGATAVGWSRDMIASVEEENRMFAEAPISTKFAGNMIETQIFEGFIQVNI
jgi:hypothetical protein